jgi:GNAT superfamily N-acetyltransferase
MVASVKVIGEANVMKSVADKLFQYLGYQVAPVNYVGKIITISPPVVMNGKELKAELGYVYWPKFKVGYACYVYIDKPIRRQGIGTILSDYYFNDLKRNGIERTFIYVFNPKAMGYLKLRGYKPIDLKSRFQWMDRDLKYTELDLL